MATSHACSAQGSRRLPIFFALSLASLLFSSFPSSLVFPSFSVRSPHLLEDRLQIGCNSGNLRSRRGEEKERGRRLPTAASLDRFRPEFVSRVPLISPPCCRKEEKNTNGSFLLSSSPTPFPSFWCILQRRLSTGLSTCLASISLLPRFILYLNCLWTSSLQQYLSCSVYCLLIFSSSKSCQLLCFFFLFFVSAKKSQEDLRADERGGGSMLLHLFSLRPMT